MKIEFSSQRRETPLFSTLTHHQHGRHDVTCTWFPLSLEAKHEWVYFETGLLQEPMRFDTLNFTYVAKTTF